MAQIPLTMHERKKIAVVLTMSPNESWAVISWLLKGDSTTIGLEVRANGRREHYYSASAQVRAPKNRRPAYTSICSFACGPMCRSRCGPTSSLTALNGSVWRRSASPSSQQTHLGRGARRACGRDDPDDDPVSSDPPTNER